MAVDMIPSEIDVHDGDTVEDLQTTYRFSAIDAAECAICFGDGTGWPDQYGVDQNLSVNYCEEGRKYVEEAIYTAGRVQKVIGRIDNFNRRLAYFVVDGELLNCLLVRDGLVWETVSFYGEGSHPPLARMVAAAAEFTGDPHFTKPHIYKAQSRQPRDECR